MTSTDYLPHITERRFVTTNEYDRDGETPMMNVLEVDYYQKYVLE